MSLIKSNKTEFEIETELDAIYDQVKKNFDVEMSHVALQLLVSEVLKLEVDNYVVTRIRDWAPANLSTLLKIIEKRRKTEGSVAETPATTPEKKPTKRSAKQLN